MGDFVALLIIPVIVTILGLVVEYYVIQPMHQKQDKTPPPQVLIQKEKNDSTNLQIQPVVRAYPAQIPRKSNSFIEPFYETDYDSQIIEPEKPKPPISTVYYSLAILFISSTSALAAALLLRIISAWYYSYKPTALLSILAELIAESDFVFVAMLIIMIPAATLAASWIDSSYDKITAKTWERFSLAAIIGFISSITGCVAIPILLIFLAFIFGGNYPPGYSSGSSSSS